MTDATIPARAPTVSPAPERAGRARPAPGGVRRLRRVAVRGASTSHVDGSRRSRVRAVQYVVGPHALAGVDVTSFVPSAVETEPDDQG